MGILRAGFTVFPISPRNSSKAVAHLLRQVNAEVILVGGEPALQTLANESFKLIGDTAGSRPKLFSMPRFEDLFCNDNNALSTKRYPFVELKPDNPALILHSSGK
jgi:acyl-CoA synthetase (AMP-forming)/AMP-acid ligase II